MNGQKSRFARGGNKNSNMMPPRRRRKKFKQKPGMPTEQELIAAYLEKNRVTKCPAGYAMGSLQSTSFGLE